jgi:hypothetical protein
MQSKKLSLLVAAAIVGVSSTAIAKGGGAGGKGGSGHFHGRFDNRFLRNQFLRNQFLRNQAILGGWGLGWDWGAGYGGGTNVLVSQQSVPAFPAAAVTGSLPPCHWNEETFKVPSVFGGTQPVSVVSCR